MHFLSFVKSTKKNHFKKKWHMVVHKDFDWIMANKFLNQVEIVMYLARNTPRKMLCSCRKYKNTKFTRCETVRNHLVNREFIPHYYI